MITFTSTGPPDLSIDQGVVDLVCDHRRVTLIVVAANADFVVQVSDRRLTASGRPITDQETKAIYLQTPAFQGVIGYTGLAKIGAESTSAVLMRLLETRALPLAVKDRNAITGEVMLGLTELMQSPLGRKYTRSQRRLTVTFTGYYWYPEGWFGPTQTRITNFQEADADAVEASDEFTQWDEGPIPGAPRDQLTLIQVIGQWQEVSQQDVDALRLLLAPGKPPEAVRQKLVEVIVGIASRNSGVGAEQNSVWFTPGQPPRWSHHTATAGSVMSLGDMVGQDIDGNVLVVPGIEMRRADGGPIVVPKSHRSAPCPCKSGKNYGQCHGRFRKA